MLVTDVVNAFHELQENAGPDATPRIISSLGLLNNIKEYLNDYKCQLEDISSRFNQNGILDINNIKMFEQEAMALGRTVDRLISKADAMIRNLIEALEVESRL